ncbi:uncharacterized protein C8R40DRAFT_1132791 [Lentinula edodes]|uniref:uncharacterized protein n=1 Tax=Lentinula edodes TaxID=5353 RepID=UPI001E8ED332|nr:uncharacterized protein C8R40DRAFT_1132791 [Lentinula edodes]KAH7868951.1 hypothetical protein C8R40DRAFT_1132791 [Lentinula edodes]
MAIQNLYDSAGDMRSHLQSLLDAKEKQLQQAGTLGQRVLAQQMELEERIRQLQELDAGKADEEDLDMEAKEKYQELAESLIAWDAENAQLSSAFGKSSVSPSIPVAQLPREEPERSKASASSSAAQSRRAKNAAHRADDVEFAFEIGSGLLNEVRRLQSLLGERDKAIQDMKEEKDDLEASVESLRKALKQQEQSADKYKEENWNLEVTLQDLRTQLSNAQSTNSRLDSEQKRLTKLLAASRDTSEQFKNETSQLQGALEELTNKHETDIALARKHAAGLARDKSDLQQTIDTLKTEVARAGRRLPRFGSPLTPNGAEPNDFLTPGGFSNPGDEVFSNVASTNRRNKMSELGAYDDAFGDEFADSPEGSPLPGSPFRSANHPLNEIEVLQQRLAHAQRQILTLKGTLQREKKEKLDLRRKYEVQGPEEEDDAEKDMDMEEEEVGDEAVGPNSTLNPVSGKRRGLMTFKVGVGRGIRGTGRGRGRGRGGITLTERLNFAAHDQDDEDRFSLERDTSMPAVPAMPVHFTDEDAFDGLEGEDEDQVPDQMGFQASPSPAPSNRTSVGSITSVEGMDPAFANVLRRTPSTSSVISVQANGSPLRTSLLRRSTRGRGTIGRRTRGGAAWYDGRPPSLVDQPEDLARALGSSIGASPVSIKGDGSGIGIMEELGAEIIETAEFGCQTEPEPIIIPVLAPSLPQKLMSEASVQHEPEPEPLTIPVPAPSVSQKLMSEASVQHEPELELVLELPPIPVPDLVEASMQTAPEPVVDRDEVGVQHFPPLVSMSTSTDPPPTKYDVEVEARMDEAIRERRDTLVPGDVSIGSSVGDSTIKNAPGRAFLSSSAVGHGDEIDDGGEETETGPDTEIDTDDYEDATQSIIPSTASASRDDFHSMMTMTDSEVSDSDDDGESIKASRLPVRRPHAPSLFRTSSFYETPAGSSSEARVMTPPTLYDSKSVEVDILPELPTIAPKPEVKEMSTQTDDWVPSVLAPVGLSPAGSSAPSSGSPALYRVGSSSKHQFQFIPPAPLQAPYSAPVSVPTPSPSTNVFKETPTGFATIMSNTRSSHDRRQSMDSVISSVIDDVANTGTRSRIPSTLLVDKTRPPMMSLPPPPRAPPPPGSMPPPSFIPERRIPTNSTGSSDAPPPRPSSPPPPELIQRATTPTFGSVLSVPGGKGNGFALRQHGSSMPPSQAGLRQPPSTSSFRSAANATAYHQHGAHVIPSLRGERVGVSTTSLASDRSLASPRSSLSSDHHLYLNRSQHAFHNQNVNPNATITPNKFALSGDPLTGRAPPMDPTDPAVIHAITQTMIGEFLYKYTRKALGKGYGTARHKRFFWVHPYTKTLYWSSADPNSTNVAESSAKSAYIEGVRQVLDPNPMPPGLYQYSVVVSTPQREMKFTAPTKDRHEIWLNSLKYLLARHGPSQSAPGNATVVPDSPTSGEEFLPEDDRHLTVNSSPRSQRTGRSLRSDTPFNTTPRGKRSRSQMSMGGSIGRRAGTPAAEYLRWNGPESPYSPSRSFVDVPAQEDEDDLDFELHGDSFSDDGFEGLENVRACCDGRHTVGHSGKHHHHHHHHHESDSQNGDHNHTGSSNNGPIRPVSPSAWSFRSRTGSANSHEGGSASLFSWGRGRTEDGKSKFGSRRSTKTVQS